ncbi:MAG TPA: XrtA/PEP-CTERM system exopolysaccharide export protein [Burkholderiaceae bacterium]
MSAFASVARQLRALFVLALGAGALAGCVATHPPVPAAAASAEDVYKVGPLDSLNIVVWRNTDLSGTVQVRPDGRISTPLVQDLDVAGKTPPEIAREIEKALGKYVRDPNVTVLVTSFQGTFSEQIRIVGEAAKPQAIAYRQNMTLLDVMIQAGGLTDFADGNSAVLVRNNTSYTVRLKDLLKRGDISANAAVAPGDVIIVPQSWF